MRLNCPINCPPAVLCALFPTMHIQHYTLRPLTQWVLLDNEMLDSSTLIKALMNNMISLPAATEGLVWGNRDCVLGNAVHGVGTSVLISKCSFSTAGLVWKRRPGEKTEFEGNIPLYWRGEQSRHHLPTTRFLMPHGLTSQQDINTKKFNKKFSALPGCQVLLLALQICHSNLTCCSLLLCET